MAVDVGGSSIGFRVAGVCFYSLEEVGEGCFIIAGFLLQNSQGDIGIVDPASRIDGFHRRFLCPRGVGRIENSEVAIVVRQEAPAQTVRGILSEFTGRLKPPEESRNPLAGIVVSQGLAQTVDGLVDVARSAMSYGTEEEGIEVFVVESNCLLESAGGTTQIALFQSHFALRQPCFDIVGLLGEL